MSEKNKKISRNLGYRLRLNDEEFDILHICSRHAHMKTSDFLRMLINNYAESNGIIDESTEYYTHKDNKFEAVEDTEQKLIEVTNDANNSEEMYMLFGILYRFWQTGCLDQFLEDVERLSKND